MKSLHIYIIRCTLLVAMLFAVSWTSIKAQDTRTAYAALNSDNTVLTFYYDDQKESRNGMDIGPFTNGLNNNFSSKGWYEKEKNPPTIKTVVFDSSFANYSPTSTAYWFQTNSSIERFVGWENLNTANVTDMTEMFSGCGVKTLDLSTFNTSNVNSMGLMFYNCTLLKTIYVGNEWSTSSLTDEGGNMFHACTNLIGGAGTTYSADHTNASYAHIDGGESNPGYFTDASSVDGLEIYVVDTNSTFTPLEPITPTPSIVLTPGNNTEWLVNDYLGFDSQRSSIDFAANTYYPNKTITKTFSMGMCGTDNPVDGNGSSYVPRDKNLPSLGSYVIFEPKQDGSLILPVSINASKQLFVTDGNGNINTDIQVKNANGQTLRMLASPLCAFSDMVTNGFISMNVKQGQKYYVFCTGSKMHLGGYVFSTEAIEIDSGTMSNVKDALAGSTEPYAILADNTLTFYYDNQRFAKNGMSVGPFTNQSEREWSNQTQSITTVVFDSSFANCTTVNSTAYWFDGCSTLTSIRGIDNLKTDNVTNMESMFNSCSSLTSLDLRSFNTANVTDMAGMFALCSSLTSLDLSNFNTANVTNMRRMFYDCSGLTNLDLRYFNTGKVTYMDSMLQNCSNITTITVGEGWTVENLQIGKQMFLNCTSLKGGAGTTYDASHVDHTYAHIDGGDSNPGYFTDKNAPVGQVATPTFAWNGDQLTMTTETEGADIYYSMSRYGAEPTGDGSETNPFNVAAAIAKCREIGETASAETYYVKGVVSQITEPYSATNGNARFNISDNGSNQNFFIAYRVLYIGNQRYTEGQQQVQVGDDVVVCGSLVNYRDNIPETAQNTGYLVSMTTPELTTKYESPITVSGNVVIRAKAVKQGLDDSNIAMTSTGIAAYAALNDDNTVLTFYYDDQKNTRNGMDIGPFTLYFNNADNTHSVTGRPWESNASTITTVIFDESLANYTQLTNMVAWFTDFTKLTTIQGLNYLNTEKVTDMSGLFWGCSSLRTLDLSTFNTSNVTSMWSMFDDCTSLTSLNISTFKTSKVTDMRGMFYGCSSLTTLNLSHFDTSNVVYFNSMFRNCSNLTSVNVGSFNTGNAEVIQVMFGYCPKLTTLNLSSFNTAKVTNMVSLFRGCTSLETILVGPDWVVSNTGASGGTTDIGENMFYGCTSLKGGKGTVYDDTHTGSEYARIDNAPDAPGYFTDKNAPAANPEPYAVLSENNTVLTFYYDDQMNTRGGMNIADRGWSQDAASITKVQFDSSFADYYPTSTNHWFDECSNLTSVIDIENLKLDRATDISWMFRMCSGLTTLDVRSWNTANVTEMGGLFYGCTSLTSLDVSSFNTQKVTNMESMFGECHALTSVDVSSFNTENVTNMDFMFGATAISELNLSNFNTDKVTNMRWMFSGVGVTSVLKTVNLSGFNTSKVTNMEGMFNSNPNLTTIYVGEDWSTSNVTNGADMFTNCTNLKGGAGTPYDANHTDYTYAHIDGGESNPGYFTSGGSTTNAEAYAVLSENNTVLTFYYDDQMNTRGGMNIADRGWSQDAASITKVQFDSTFVNYYPTSTREWFNGCLNLTSIVDMKYLKLDRTTDMSGLACTSLTSLDVSGFNTQQVTNMQDMFRACTNLTSLDLSRFNTQNVTEMYGMFYNCTNLKSLDLSNFDTRNVRNMDHLFRFCTNLVNLNISGFSTANGAFQRNMFEGCSSLASIQAGNAVIADSTYAQIGNPNLLLYVNEASQTPQSVRNVVVLDEAEQIVLTDTVGNNNFYCPKQFTAKSISYTRNFKQTTQVGVSRGWETIALPFAVQTITHEKNGTLTPFGVEGGKPFWLRELTGNGLVSARHMDANVPYLISMPNNSIYPDDYNQAGNVTFSATNAVVPVTESRETSGNNRTLIPTMMSVAQSPDIYVINRDTTYQNNPQGSIFVADYREVRPFEAYVKHVGGARYFSLSEIPQLDVTGIESIELKPWKGEQWWTLDGRKLNRRPSKKGIYIRNGKKVVVDATF